MDDNMIFGNLEGLPITDSIRHILSSYDIERVKDFYEDLEDKAEKVQKKKRPDVNIFQEEAIKEAYEEGLEEGSRRSWLDVRTNPPGDLQSDEYNDLYINLVWTLDDKVFLAYYNSEVGYWYKAFESSTLVLKVRKYITIKLP